MAWPEQTGDKSWRVRYRRDDGTIGSIPGFPDEQAADTYIADMAHQQRTGKWTDPAAGQITVAAYAPNWIDSIDVDQRTEENYNSFLKCHIYPRWGTTALADITNLQVQKWAKQLRNSGLAVTTVASILKLFSLMLSDAADDDIIPANPIRARKRGRRHPHPTQAQGLGRTHRSAPRRRPSRPDLRPRRWRDDRDRRLDRITLG